MSPQQRQQFMQQLQKSSGGTANKQGAGQNKGDGGSASKKSDKKAAKRNGR